MKRALIPEPHRATAVEAEPPPVEMGEARLAIRACGICGSDLHTFEGRQPFVTYPVYPGHELSGVVAEVGTHVPGLWVGQRVAVEPSLVCGDCENCRAGRYNICDQLKVMGFQVPGGMADQFVTSVGRLVRLPAALTDEQGACVEPVAVAVHAVRLAAGVTDRDVLVLGAGTIGLLVTQVARAHGTRRVVVTDALPTRRALAARLDLDAADASHDDLDALVRDRFFGRRPDIVFECVGIEATFRQAVELVRKGGEIIVVGVFGQDVRIPAPLIQDRELEVRGSLMYTRRDFEEAIRLIAEGQVRVDPLISHRLPLAAVDQAFTLAHNRTASLKVMVIP